MNYLDELFESRKINIIWVFSQQHSVHKCDKEFLVSLQNELKKYMRLKILSGEVIRRFINILVKIYS